MDVTELTIKKLHEGLLRKEFSAREVIDQFIERIEKYDGEINSFITRTFDGARADADKADKKIADYGEQVFKEFPLLGVPIAHKDLYLTQGIRTTAASKVLENYIPQYSSTSVVRLEKAGAIVLGKLNCDAWGHGSSGENSDFGPTRNPWDTNFVPGGSSSGSGASVAAGFALAATGTDTGGSIRLPASFCSVVGVKPTYGRVSRYGVVAMASSLDSMCHMARTVEDAAMILKITAGKDEHDATSSNVPVPNYLKDSNKGVRGLRIGLPKEYFGEGLSGEIRDVVLAAAKKLEKEGAEIVDVSLPSTEYGISSYYILMASEVSSNLSRYDGVRYGKDRSFFGPEAKRRIMLGTYSLSKGYADKYYNQADKARNLIKDDFVKVFESVDILLSPISPTPPFRLGEKSDDPLKMYLSDVLTVGVNLAGLPALALPCGFTTEGLPIGMQFIGKEFDEATLFQGGAAFQTVTDFHTRNPKL
ncbi:MAG: Asp-tRNA(Asn)/Glu-tRNA(Gln) amidotransferase subunit GatA [bacterium]|nr:Asp-tRNA(Asn)/Glu-tRNA(Gln) amidotransferase subunit GatA [bacterium]